MATPTVQTVSESFLAEQQGRLSDKTFRNYEAVIRLLGDCLKGTPTGPAWLRMVGAKRAELEVRPENNASIRAAERAGFRGVGGDVDDPNSAGAGWAHSSMVG